MSTAAVSGVESVGDCGSEGTNGCLGASAGGVGVGWSGLRGAEAGDNWAKVVVEYKNESSRASEKDKTHCSFIILVFYNEGLDDRNCSCNEVLMHWWYGGDGFYRESLGLGDKDR